MHRKVIVNAERARLNGARNGYVRGKDDSVQKSSLLISWDSYLDAFVHICAEFKLKSTKKYWVRGMTSLCNLLRPARKITGSWNRHGKWEDSRERMRAL
jgi:hypothetical protein